MLTRRSVPLVIALALSCVVGAQPSAPRPNNATLDKARRIVDNFTPQHDLHVPAFSGGLRPVGVSLPTTPFPTKPGQPAVTFDVPEWLDADALLGEVVAGRDVDLRLLWKREALPEISVDERAFSIRLVSYLGHGKVDQGGAPAVVTLKDFRVGEVQWSVHRLRLVSGLAPGLYNVILTSADTPVEKQPLGQILVRSHPLTQPEIWQRAREVFGKGQVAFGGSAVLAPWHSFHLSVSDVDFTPSAVGIVSSAEWLEAVDTGETVGAIEVETAQGTTLPVGDLLLGQHSASTWYAFHARGNIAHEQAPIAWSWPEEVRGIEFQAAAYKAVFPWPDGADSPKELTIRCAGEQGVLRVRAIVFLP